MRFEDIVGINGVDAAADLGDLKQHHDVITARRDLRRGKFMVAIFRIESIMMVLLALFLMPWFGTKVVLSKLEPTPFLLSSIMPLPDLPGFLNSTLYLVRSFYYSR